MGKDGKGNQGPVGSAPGKETTSNINETQYKLTTIVSIIAIVAAIIGVVIGAYCAIWFQNWNSEQNTAKLIYDDMDRMDWSINSYHQAVLIEQNTPNSIVGMISPIYPDNGIYSSSRRDITLLKPSLARNISNFYSDLQWAEIYRNVINKEFENNDITVVNSTGMISLTPMQSAKISISKYQLENGILDAYAIRPQIMDELEKTYNIPKNPPNRFNHYP